MPVRDSDSLPRKRYRIAPIQKRRADRESGLFQRGIIVGVIIPEDNVTRLASAEFEYIGFGDIATMNERLGPL